MISQRAAWAASIFNFIVLPMAFLVLSIGHDSVGLALGVITVGTVSLVGWHIWRVNQ